MARRSCSSPVLVCNVNIILLTVIFMFAGGKATFTLEFTDMDACEKELAAYVGYLKAQNVTPLEAKCESNSTIDFIS